MRGSEFLEELNRFLKGRCASRVITYGDPHQVHQEDCDQRPALLAQNPRELSQES